MKTKYWDIYKNEGCFNKVFAKLEREIGRKQVVVLEFWFDSFDNANYEDTVQAILSDKRLEQVEKEELLCKLNIIQNMLIVEERKAKILFNKSGGTASGENAITYRVTLPSTWVKNMNITKDDRNVKLSFDDTKIVIQKIKNS